LYDLHNLDLDSTDNGGGSGSPRNGKQIFSAAHHLEERLAQMITSQPWRATAFAKLAESEVPFLAAKFAALVSESLAKSMNEPELKARYLDNAATYRSILGRHEEALAAGQEAVNIRRVLAHGQPEPLALTLAASLNNFANFLAELGRHEEALAAGQEAVNIRRRLVGGMFFELTSDQALSLGQELANMHHDIASATAKASRPGLALSLSNIANLLSELGRHEEALAAGKEGLNIRRDLAQAGPEAFTPDLGKSLNSLAKVLSKLGRREEALAAEQEAVNIFRDLAQTRPEAFTPDLGISVNNLANFMSACGRHEEALVVGQEAVNLFRILRGCVLKRSRRLWGYR